MLSDKQVTKIRKAFNGTNQRAIFKILGDTNRYRIFEMLAKEPRISVSDIAKVLKISIPLASQHLKILEQGNMLEKEKQGQKVYYKLRADNLLAGSISKDII
ncbi:MAG TPA: metalloregulator ArsR/SmtB family transcription factor [Candidatus Limnocylindria bacterium]|nr:metalloregulator ArsR/SmtB family transcription factor [Candidatus Limnocylindria bacterium]